MLRKSFAQNPYGPQCELPGRFGIVRQIPDDNDLFRANIAPKSPQRRLENIKMRFRLFGIIRGGLFINEVQDAGSALIPSELLAFGRRSVSMR